MRSVDLTERLGHLGTRVEVRELTVGQWLAMQPELADADEQSQSMRMLAEALHIDGEPIGWDGLMALGMSDLAPAVGAMTSINGGDEPGEA